MTHPPCIDDLRRRVRRDPRSIAFAQLAEELRRDGQFQEAADTCVAGLAVHSGYLSARVTLGRALVDLDRLDDAQHELEQVRKVAPENLAAVRALAEIHRRRGLVGPAQTQHEPVSPVGPQAAEPRDPIDRAVLHHQQMGGEVDPARAIRTLTALEEWLAAIHVARAGRSA